MDTTSTTEAQATGQEVTSTNAVETQGIEPKQVATEAATPTSETSAAAEQVAQATETPEQQAQREAQELFNQRFAQLNKRQKEVQSQYEELKKLKAELDPLIKLKQNPNPKKVLDYFGVQMDKFAKDYLTEPDEADPIMQRVLAAEKAAAEAARRLEERELKDAEMHETAQRNAVKAIIKSEVDAMQDLELVHNIPDRYEAIQEIIAQQYEKTGRMMSAKDAAIALENYLEQETKDKIMKSKKVRQWLAEADAPAQVAGKPATQPGMQTKTLTNSIPVQSTPNPEDEGPMENESFVAFRERHLRKLASQIKGL